MSEQSPSFPVFEGHPPAESVDEIEDPLHIGDRDPVDLEHQVADERLGPLPPLPPGAAYVLTAGEEVERCPADDQPKGPRIVFDAGGLRLVDGGVSRHCLGATKLVWVEVERRPTGYLSRGDHFVVAVDRAGRVVGRVDTSEVLSPMRPDCVKQICDLAGIGFEEVTSPDVDQLLDRRPELVPPKLEFEADHPRQEGIREVADGVGWVVPLSLVLGGAGMAAFVDATPFGLPYRLFGGFAVLVTFAMVAWSRSGWRERRSLAARTKKRQALVGRMKKPVN